MKSKLTLLLALSLFLAGVPGLPDYPSAQPWQMAQAQSQKKVALVIGNKDYTSSPLKNTLNDARDVAAKLKKLGFEVILKENLPDEKAMKRALLDASEQIQPGGVFLFYYSGHGMQVRGTNYLIPTQAQIRKEKDVEFEGLDFNRVLAEIEAGKAGVNIVLLDACRDNPFGSGFKSGSKGLAGITQSPAGTFIGFATAPGGVSSDNISGRNGLFTGELLKYLDAPGLKIEDIFKRTAKGVQTKEKQTPWSNSSLTDDFYFIPPSGGSPHLPVQPSAAPQEPAAPALNYEVADPACIDCPSQGQAGENLVFKFKLSYEGPEQVRAVVDWGDGSSQSMGGWLTDSGVSTLAHRYSRGGQYTIQVRGWTQGGKKSAGSLRQGVAIAAPQLTATPVPLATARPTPMPVRVPVSVPTPRPVPQNTPRPVQNLPQEVSNSLGMEFKLIPAGSFMMGSPSSEEGRYDNETQHRVTLTQSYYMQTTEVTQAQWEAVMGNNPSHFKGDRNLPVEQVSWEEVQIFISALNRRGEGQYRLPTEAEWEYAARSGSSSRYSLGDSESSLGYAGWIAGNSDYKTHPVGQKQPNGWGLYDMHGNVWELVQDWYGDYPTGSVTDPQGAGSGSQRVIRGGGWEFGAHFARSAIRRDASHGIFYKIPGYLGFRLVRSQK